MSDKDKPKLRSVDKVEDITSLDDNSAIAMRNSSGEAVAIPKEIALAACREYRAWEDHEAGIDWAMIAAKHDYPSAEIARRSVGQWLKESKALVMDYTRREMIGVQNARLNALLSFVWPAAKKGSIAAVNSGVGIVMSQSKLNGLLEFRDDDEEASGPRTVVIPHDDAGFTQALESVVAD